MRARHSGIAETGILHKGWVCLIVTCMLTSSVGSRVLASPQLPGQRNPSAAALQDWSESNQAAETARFAQDELILEWRTPDARFVSRAEGRVVPNAVNVELPGYWQSASPGEPQLPFTSTLIALPPDAAPTLRVLSIQETELPLPPDASLALAPFPDIQRDAEGHPVGVTPSSVPARPEGFGKPFGSKEPVVLEPAGVMRGVRLARVMFYPVRPLDAQSHDRLRVTTYLRISVAFNTPFPSAPSLSGYAPSLYPLPRSCGGPRSAGEGQGGGEKDPLLNTLKSAVANPDQVCSAFASRAVRDQSDLPLSGRPTSDLQPPTSNLQPPTSNLRSQGEGSWAIEVVTPGLTAITYEALAAAGFSVASADPHNLRLMRAGNEIAVEWDGDDDTAFEAGERLLFYADPRFSRWTNSDVYFLREDTTPGLRMSSRSAAPSGQPTSVVWVNATAEVNALYTPECFECGSIPAGRDGDRWTWDVLKLPDRLTGSYTIQLLPAVDATRPATLTLWLIGYTDVSANPDHRVDVKLGSASLGLVEWNGKQAITATLSITPGLLHGNINTVTLTLPGDLPEVSVEGMWLDAFSVTHARSQSPAGASVRFETVAIAGPAQYTVALNSSGPYRVYDVTDSIHPQKLTDTQVSGNAITLGDPGGGLHRYIAAAPDGILPPTRVRAAENPWSFQSGTASTGADVLIITHPAFASALGPLVSLRQSQGLSTTLVNVLGFYDAWGDGRPDPVTIRNFIANAYSTWTPRPTYVLLVGDGSFDPKGHWTDSPPTFIPPYLDNVDPWGNETAADNRYVTVDGSDNLPDLLIGRLAVQTLTETQTIVDKIVRYETDPLPGGWNKNVTFVADKPAGGIDFTVQPEFIIAHYVTSPFTPQRIYYKPSTTTITATRQAVMSAWDAGALIMQFNGHSSWQQWATDRIFHLDDLPMLRNDRRWPIVLEMTCFTGAFQRPDPTLDKELVKLKGGGAVAAWGPTTLGQSAGHDILDDGFFEAVFSDTLTLGQVILQAKLKLLNHPNYYQYRDLLDTFTLLGDPALRPNRTIVPWPHELYLPVVARR